VRQITVARAVAAYALAMLNASHVTAGATASTATAAPSSWLTGLAARLPALLIILTLAGAVVALASMA
jgi:hypothetical protein